MDGSTHLKQILFYSFPLSVNNVLLILFYASQWHTQEFCLVGVQQT